MVKNKINWCKITIKIGISTTTMLSVVQPASAILYNRFEFTDIYGNIDINGDVDWDASLDGTAPGGTITGTIGFDEKDLDTTLSGTIPATSFVIDSVPSYFQSIWQNTNFGIGNNLVGTGNLASNSFTRTYNYFDTQYNPANSFTLTNGVITDYKFEERYYLGIQEPNNADNEQYEWIVLGGAENENSLLDPAYNSFGGIFPGNFLEIAYQLDDPLLVSGPVTYSDVFVYDFDNNITFAAVPFEFSPGFGLLACGGIWGILRFRKGMANRKTIN